MKPKPCRAIIERATDGLCAALIQEYDVEFVCQMDSTIHAMCFNEFDENGHPFLGLPTRRCLDPQWEGNEQHHDKTHNHAYQEGA